jgi:hypothetical protein
MGAVVGVGVVVGAELDAAALSEICMLVIW